MTKSCTHRRLYCVFVAAISFTVLGISQTLSPTEYQVKAAFLYNFAKFVEWPTEAFSDTTTPIIIGILGDDPFESDLDQIVKGKRVNGREFVIKRFKELEDLEICHILFISTSEHKNLSKITRTLKNSGVLTVSEMKEFTKMGGIINFILEENKVRFEINVDAAEREGLKLSSQLLKLARIVKEREEK